MSGDTPTSKPTPPEFDPVRVETEANAAWTYVLDSADTECCRNCMPKLVEHLRNRPGLARHIVYCENPIEA